MAAEAPSQTRKRHRKRRRHASLDLSSSSSSEGEEHEQVQEDKDQELKQADSKTQVEQDTESDDSSAVFSSSDEDIADASKSRRNKQKGTKQTLSTSADAEAEPKSIIEEEPVQEPVRPPTPPYLFWNKSIDDPADDILQDEKIQFDTQSEHSASESRFQKFYMKQLVAQFSDDLDAMRETDPNFTTAALSNLISSLAEGSNTYDLDSQDVVMSSNPELGL